MTTCYSRNSIKLNDYAGQKTCEIYVVSREAAAAKAVGFGNVKHLTFVLI